MNNEEVIEQLKVHGMDCNNCALTIAKHLQKKGLQNVKVNFINGEVSFNKHEDLSITDIKKEISSIGYSVVEETTANIHKSIKLFSTHLQRFWFCLVFALPLFIGHIVHIHWLMNPWVQLGCSLPVYIIGMQYFGKSAIRSIVKGVPNMNVLIALGSTAAMLYSLYGLLTAKAMEFMFFETAATTITLVFLGNYLEDKSIQTTQTALQKLVVSKKLMANMIAFDDKYQEQIFSVEAKDLRVGDLVLIKTGEEIPADCKILWGSVEVNESIITGESIPVHKQEKDLLIAGSIVATGSVKAQVTAVGSDTALSKIVQLMQQAQTEKPPVQQLADKISAVFVPVVIGIAVLTLLINYFGFTVSFKESLLRCIAVLVIACPCAMGLATPAAIAVGLGRAASNGILFKNAKSLEAFKNINAIVFDKTGTLTTGDFIIKNYGLLVNDCSDEGFKMIAYSLEKYSNHPLAKTIQKNWKPSSEIKWQKVEDVKGFGIKATDKQGNNYVATSYKNVAALTKDVSHQIYIVKNNTLIGWIDLEDEIRPEAKEVISYFHTHNIKTILLSGDTEDRCKILASELGINTVYAEQTPANKLQIIEQLNIQNSVAMVGDGINDAPALAKATVGISVGNASQISIQAAQVILIHGGLKYLPKALGIGKHTYITIKENLFWALAYNIVAIPVAAIGLLGTYGPTYGALIMGLSDVVLAVNSLRLRFKKLT